MLTVMLTINSAVQRHDARHRQLVHDVPDRHVADMEQSMAVVVYHERASLGHQDKQLLSQTE